MEEPEQWKATAYAYVRGGVSVIVTGSLVDLADPANPRRRGKHAVVLAGYSLGGAPSAGTSGTSLVFTASRIDKFYAHDDQIGAFARMPDVVHEGFHALQRLERIGQLMSVLPSDTAPQTGRAWPAKHAMLS